MKAGRRSMSDKAEGRETGALETPGNEEERKG